MVESPRDDCISIRSKTQGSVNVVDTLKAEAQQSLQHTQFEHNLKFWQAIKIYQPAILWCLLVNLAVVLAGFDGALIGSLVGIESFTKQFGYLYKGEYIVQAKWLGAMNYAGLVGNAVGSMMAGYGYDILGPRTTLGLCCLGSIGSIFLQFFSSTVEVLFAGELLNGIIVGFYPVIASAYIGEVMPIVLRGVVGSIVNLAFVIGQLVASGVLKGTNTIDNKWAYKIPFACQWLLPVIIIALIFFCPTPPYWLARRGRVDDAERSLERLSTKAVDSKAWLANVTETLRLEADIGGGYNYVECFRGTNLRRLIISIMVYQLQPLLGNILFINYAVYFFTSAGLSSSSAFSMNMGITCLGFLGTILSWPLMTLLGRRPILLYGSLLLTILVFLIGILDLIPTTSTNTGPIWAQCSLMIVANFVYDLSAGPLCFVLLCEVSAAKVRGATIAIANVMVYVTSVIFAVGIPYALNADQANWGGKLGFLFAGLGLGCTVWCYFCLPETKGRTFEELDVMFERRVDSRLFENYEILGAEGVEGTEIA